MIVTATAPERSRRLPGYRLLAVDRVASVGLRSKCPYAVSLLLPSAVSACRSRPRVYVVSGLVPAAKLLPPRIWL